MLQALLDLRRSGVLPTDEFPEVRIDRARDTNHGDYATNIALLLGKSASVAPLDLAEQIVAALPSSQHLEGVSTAKPGFINFRLNRACRLGVLRRIGEQGESFGTSRRRTGERITVEFVSANPTGPLHVGHGRGAAFGASIARLLETQGHEVQREYYVNDDGRQMDILAVSVWLRYLELGGTPMRFPDNGYRGDYVLDIARGLRLAVGDSLRRPIAAINQGLPPDEAEGGDRETHIDALIKRARSLLGQDYDQAFAAGLDAMLADIRDDLAGFRVHFDGWFSERSLSTDGFIDRALDRLTERGHLYEADGATWFRATAFGDEKDRVVVRENGQRTYFASDIGYLLSKFERGFERAIYIFGADHHGYVARLLAAAEGLGLDRDRVEILLVQFAVLYEGGQKVQMSTRSGQFVTLRELREDVGTDAARFFYVMRGHEQHLDFDLDLAREHSNENPVYYVQYAHARIAALLRQLAEKHWSFNRSSADANREKLDTPHETVVLDQLMRYPETLATASTNRAPQLLAQYLRDLAASFHSCYNAVEVLVPDDGLRNARLGLALATQQVLASGLAILGVEAPERM